MHLKHSNELPTAVLAATQSRSLTWRSVLLGTLSVIAVCALVPYNDYVLADISLAAGYIPLAAVIIEFFLIIGINAPLHRWAPRYALSSGELSVVVLMLLVGCSLPNWGLMRFLIPMPVSSFHVTDIEGRFWPTFLKMDLPKWLFAVDNMSEGRGESVVTWFYSSRPQGLPIPWSAWMLPLACWGIFIAAMLATLVAVARMVLDQWLINERLPFPLVQVHAALVEAPSPGRALNNLFRNPLLWIGLGGVMFIHLLSILHVYFPKNFPTVALKFDISPLVADTPLQFLRGRARSASLFFTLVGVTYFIRSKVAFSMWSIYLLMNLWTVEQRIVHADFTTEAWSDLFFGACIAFVVGFLWIGRHHWARIIKNAFGVGTDSTYRVSFWVATLGTTVMMGWLMVVGVQWWVAALIIAFILTAHLVISRVLAETGLPTYRCALAVTQAYYLTPISWLTPRDVFFSGVFTALGPLTTREGVMPLTMHGLGVCHANEVDQRHRRGIGVVLAWALLIGCVAAAASTLYVHYSYATPVNDSVLPAGNQFGAERIPKREMADPLQYYTQGKFKPKAHSVPWHLSVGFAITLGLQIASLRWASWPLLPVGFVTSYGAFIEIAWFSIFVGWLAKVLVVRFGGSSLFVKARPFFVGIIFGEALAAALFLIVNAIVVLNGYDIKQVRILPA